jgi:hypothetical protein
MERLHVAGKTTGIGLYIAGVGRKRTRKTGGGEMTINHLNAVKYPAYIVVYNFAATDSYFQFNTNQQHAHDCITAVFKIKYKCKQ